MASFKVKPKGSQNPDDDSSNEKQIKRRRKSYIDMTPREATNAVRQIITARGARPSKQQGKYVQDLVQTLSEEWDFELV